MLRFDSRLDLIPESPILVTRRQSLQESAMEHDTVFHQSSSTWAWGSGEVLNTFAGSNIHVTPFPREHKVALSVRANILFLLHEFLQSFVPRLIEDFS